MVASVGGQSSLADYCTYFVAYSDGSCTDTNSARAPDRMLGEVRGSKSRWSFFLIWTIGQSPHLCLFDAVKKIKINKNMINVYYVSISRCMASSLVRTGFVRGSMTQGNGCYQHRCVNNSLEVGLCYDTCLILFRKMFYIIGWLLFMYLGLSVWYHNSYYASVNMLGFK